MIMPSKAKIAKSIADMAVELSSKVGTPAIRRADMPFKDVTKRIPELTEGAKRLGAGEINAADYSKLVSQHKPVDPYEFVPEPASVDDAIRALTRTSRERPGLPSKESYFGIPSKTLKEGDPVGIRLDIPSYEKEGTWIATIHGPQKGKNVYAGAGPRIGYEPFAAATDVSFMVQPKGALSIAQGSPKGTIATMEGKWKPLQADSVHKTASDYMKDPEWVQVGMDPTRHSYFYDRKTMQPVVGADEVIQVGPLVLARKPRYGNPKDFPFKGGGPVHKAGGGIMDAIEAAKASGKAGKPIALTPSPEWEREKYELAKRLMAASRAADRLGGSVPISGKQSDEYVPKREYEQVGVYEPTLKDRFKGVVEGGLRAVGSPRPRAESLANIAGEAAEFLPTPILAETAGRSFGQNLRKGNYGSAALDLIDPALYTIPLAPAAGRAVVKGAKALAPQFGNLAEQYMVRTGGIIPLDVWHGSPHKMAPTAKNPLGEFDPTKIGTGEGNQAYGYGHYVAERPGVAERYRHAGKMFIPADGSLPMNVVFKGKGPANQSALDAYGTLRHYDQDPKKVAEMLRMDPKFSDEAKWLEKNANDISIENASFLYKVDLPDEQIAKMLDWDKPLSEQPESVQKVLKDLAERDAKMYGEGGGLDYYMGDPESYSGESVYRYLTEQLSGQPEASSFLKEAGIPGVKYFDAASRDAGEGTRNFVVFPGGEEMLTIKERMKDGGVAHKAAGGIARRLAKYAKSFEPNKKTEIFIGWKSPLWNAAAGKKAVELEKAGVAPVDIWKQTGTFRSPDGDLRQEISDVGSMFRGEKEMKELAASMNQQEADIKQKIKESKEHPDLFPKQLKTAQGELRQQAKDIKARRTMESGPEYRVGLGNRAEFALEHPELYKAYPLLSGMDVQQGGRSGSALGGYSRGIHERDPGMVNIYDRGLANDPRSTMIHEAQHAIQNIEGWGRGGNTAMAFQNPEAHKILEGLRKEASTPLSFEDWYENNFKNSASYHLFGGKDINQAKKLYEDYAKAVPMLAKKFDREYQEQAARLYYDRLAGEAEARAAQARIDLTPEQRRDIFPLEVGDYGYDVKPEDIIVKRNKKGGQVSLDAMRLAVGGLAEDEGRSSLDVSLPPELIKELIDSDRKAKAAEFARRNGIQEMPRRSGLRLTPDMIEFDKNMKGFAGRATYDIPVGKYGNISPYIGGFVIKPKGMDAMGRLTNAGITYTDRFKDGGKVRKPVSLDAMRLAVGGMASGGVRRLISEGIESAVKAGKAAKKVEKEYRTPAKFERAPAKTVEEIEAIARRMAPQYLGEFVRKPESTFSVAGKSMKQYKREKDLPIVYSGERPTPAAFDIAKHEGEMMVGVPGDPTIAHRTLEQIGDIKPENPVQLYGGPLYGLEGEFWASGRGAATGLQSVAQRGSEAYGGVPVLGKYVRMPEGTSYALHTTDALIQFLRPDMLGKKKLEQLNSEIRKGSSKYKFPEFVGFEDPYLVLLQAQDNPNLRKHIDNVLLKPTTADKYGFKLSGPDIDAAITEAELRNLETGATGFSVGRLYPRANLTESAHPTYELDIPGRMIGQTKYPQPYELSFPDTLKFVRENLKPGVGEFGMFKMSGPRQIIDAQLIDEIKMYEDAMKRLTGKKKGGSVKLVAGGAVSSAQNKEMAEGGQITSDDLILEERAL